LRWRAAILEARHLLVVLAEIGRGVAKVEDQAAGLERGEQRPAGKRIGVGSESRAVTREGDQPGRRQRPEPESEAARRGQMRRGRARELVFHRPDQSAT